MYWLSLKCFRGPGIKKRLGKGSGLGNRFRFQGATAAVAADLRRLCLLPKPWSPQARHCKFPNSTYSIYIYISIISYIYIYIYISYIYIYIYTYLIPHKPLCPSLHTRSSRSPRMPQHAIGRLRRSSEHGGRGSVFKRARLRKGFKQKRSAMASCASFGPSALPKASRHFLLSSCLGPTLLSLVMYHSSMSPCFSLS